MKKTALLLLVLLTLLITNAFGIDITQYGYKVIDSFEEQDTTVYVVEDQAGNRFEFIGSDITARQAGLLMNLRKEFEGLEFIKIKSLRIGLADSRIESIIIPESFTYMGTDLTQYLPSGMQFYYENYLEYDFRMLIGKLFVRLKGQFFSEVALAERMVEAVADPVRFIQTHDPEYIIKKLVAVDETLERLKAADFETQGKIAAKEQAALEIVGQLKAADTEAREKNSALEQDLAELTEDYEQLKAAHDALKSNYDDLKTSHDSLETEVARLKSSTVLVSSHGAFGKIKEMDPAMVDKVVSMKQADPSLSIDAAVGAMKAEGTKISKDQVYIIFTVFFPEGE